MENQNALHLYSHDGIATLPPAGRGVVAAAAEAYAETAAHRAGLDRSNQTDDCAAGPFDGYRVGLLETPVRISDLGLGGCFVNSTHEQRKGLSVLVKIDLPEEGWIAVNAETVGSLPGLGYAIRFVDVDADTAQRLNRTVDRLKGGPAHISKAPKPF